MEKCARCGNKRHKGGCKGSGQVKKSVLQAPRKEVLTSEMSGGGELAAMAGIISAFNALSEPGKVYVLGRLTEGST